MYSLEDEQDFLVGAMNMDGNKDVISETLWEEEWSGISLDVTYGHPHDPWAKVITEPLERCEWRFIGVTGLDIEKKVISYECEVFGESELHDVEYKSITFKLENDYGLDLDELELI